MNAEQTRTKQVPWKKWGPYLSERQWGTVREDYSEGGDAWNYFTHDQSRSRRTVQAPPFRRAVDTGTLQEQWRRISWVGIAIGIEIGIENQSGPMNIMVAIVSDSIPIAAPTPD
jgi:hypothetical protein